MKLSHEALQGTWITAGSEIEHLVPGEQIFHFTKLGSLYRNSAALTGRNSATSTN